MWAYESSQVLCLHVQLPFLRSSLQGDEEDREVVGENLGYLDFFFQPNINFLLAEKSPPSSRVFIKVALMAAEEPAEYF